MSENVNERVKMQTQRAMQMDAGTQFAIVKCLENISDGAFWGFCDVDEVMKHKDSLKASQPNIIVTRIGGGCIVEVNPEFFINQMAKIDAALVNQKYIENIKSAIMQTHVEMEKALKNGIKEDKIGIYCINKTPTIKLKGQPYKAFRVCVSDALRILDNFGYMVQVKGAWVSPKQAMADRQALCSSLVLSPTNTGVFLSIKKG